MIGTMSSEAECQTPPSTSSPNRPGILVWGTNGKPISLMLCTVADGRMIDIVSIIDPARLATMHL
ncbi:hypothetical protein ACFVRU_38805, partial [Streptomyces sp. NPDC057927]